MAITADMITNVSRFYVALFGRAPDGAPLAAPSQDGLSYWTQSLSNGTSLATVANQMFATTEARAYYPGYYTNEQIANSFYVNVLGRTPDAAGLAYWTAALNTAPNVGTVLYQMVVATAAYVPGSNPDPAIDAAAIVAQNLFHNRVVVAEYYGTHAGNIAGATIALNGVTDNSASIATAEAAIDAYIAAVPGLTLTLTTDANTGTAFTGGTGADTFVAVIGATSTLTAGDVLNGGSGTDTLTISATGAPAATAAIVLTGIENISIANFETTPAAIDLSQATGLAKISVTSSSATGDSTFTGLGNLVIAEMSSGTGDLTLTYTDAAVVGTTDVQTLNLTAQTAGAFTVAGATTGGVETLNISSLSAANTIAVNDAVTATITTINVTGNQNLTLTEGATNPDDAVTTINAGTFTGKLAVTTGSAVLDMSITGGTANDTITFSGNTFTAADSVNGGSGTDTLSIATAITTAATLANVTNIETLKITGANNVTLAANITATTIDVTDGVDIASTVTFNSGYTNATTVKMDGNDVVVNTSANTALTANFSSDSAVTVTGGTGTDTLNITASTSAVTFASKITKVDSIIIVDGGDVQTGTVTAGEDVTLNLGAYATALTIDGSALDAGVLVSSVLTNDETLTVDGSTATVNLIITGGGGADSITGGTANDSINAGAGNDTVTMGANLTLNDTLDGGSGTDTLSVSALTSTGLTNVTNFETLALAGSGSTATFTANLSFTTVDMSTVDNLAQVLTLSTGYTNATTVSVDDGDKVVNSANVAMTVNALADELTGTTITGGTGTDILNITADNGTVTFDSLITNVDTVTIVDGTAGKDVTLTLGSYAKALTIDASAMDAADATAGDTTAEILTVSGASVTKALTITVGAGGSTISTGTGAYNDVVTGGAGVDAITSGAGNDNYSLGDGNDTVDMTSYLDNNDTIAGGAGTDILSVNAGTIDVNYMNVTSMNTLTLLTTGTTTLSTFANAAGITTINGLDGSQNIITATGMTSNLTINASQTAANDSLTGGSGNDSFVFKATAGVTPALDVSDVVVGGAGTDTLKITMGTAAGALGAFTLTNVATIEGITVTGTAAGNITGLTTVNGNFVSVTGAAISASGMTGTGTFYFDGSAETDSTFVISGATAANTLIGGSGADTITGGAAADKITGGLGADVMTGGAGADTFVYIGAGFETGSVSPATVYYGGTVTAGTSVSTAGLDKITDFAALDTVQTAAGASANLATNATGAIWTEVAGLLKGAYDATAATFTFSTTGTDSLYVYDFDGSTATNDLRGIVLVGYVDAGAADTGTTGLVGTA